MAKRLSAKAKSAAPQTDDAADRLIALIAENQREIDLITAAADEQMSAIKAKAADAIKPLNQAIKAHSEALEAFASVHRDRLFGKAKSLQLPQGTIGWRLGNPSVRLEDEKAVLEQLRQDKRGAEFLNIKITVSREALLKGRPAWVKGVSYPQAESFFVEPISIEPARTTQTAEVTS